MKNLKSKKGFTLTELIVVIVIIGILAAVLIPTLTGYINKANESADAQEVSGLNTLLLDAKINETEFSSANQLKEYLENEMDFDGDYSLRTKGDYLWYDTKNYAFRVIGENDIEISAADTPAWVTSENIKSLEGLLQYSDGSELWIIGGNGELVNVINEVKDAVNSGSKVSTLNKMKNDSLKELLVSIFAEVKFVGDNGSFIIGEDGTVSTPTDDDSNRKDLVISLSVEKVKLFHEQVIVTNIETINKILEDEKAPVKLLLKENYNVTVEIDSNGENGLLYAASAVFKVVEILKEEGCLYGYLIPSQFANEEEYLEALNQIKNAKDDANTTILSEYLKAILTDPKQPLDLSNLESLYKIVLADLDLSDPNGLLNDVIEVLLASLNLHYTEANGQKIYDCYDINIDSANTFKNKNDIRIFGAIKSEKYGNIKVEYVFKFDVK